MFIAYSTVADGNMSYTYGDTNQVSKNRERFLYAQGISELCAEMRVTHGADICEIDRAGSDTEVYACDALITQTTTPLFLVTADCFPCVMWSAKAHVVALLHLGWKPTHERLPEKVIRYMCKHMGVSPKDISIAFGPGISKASYVVTDASQRHDARWEPFLHDTSLGTEVDIEGYAIEQCVGSGVPRDQIALSTIDTYTSSDYFSHVRSKQTGEAEGRFATVVHLAS